MTLRRLIASSFLSLLLMLFAACQSTPQPTSQAQAPVMPGSVPVEETPETHEQAEVVVPDAVVESEPVVEQVSIEEEHEEVVVPDNTITFFGEVRYVELEGGFFGIVTDDGTKFFPQYLDNNFKQDGLNVRVTALLQEEVFGIQMWGAPIQIVNIQAL